MDTPVPMVSLSRHTYDGRGLIRDDPFNATSDAEADDLEAVRVAVRVQKVPAVLQKPAAQDVSISTPAVATQGAPARDEETKRKQRELADRNAAMLNANRGKPQVKR